MATEQEQEQQAQVTDVATWKKKHSQGGLVDLPSGNKCRLRNPGMQAFLKMGFIPDSLTGLVTKALKTGKEADEAEILEALSDEQKMDELFDLYDRITIYCFVDPKVHEVPEDDEDREDDKLYVDEIDFEDKVFIFQWAVGGTRDLHRFREQQNAAVERVRGQQAVEVSAE